MQALLENNTDYLSKIVFRAQAPYAHYYLCGPLETDPLGGAKHFVLIKDDFSNHTTVFFIKQKSETKNKIVNFLTMLENQTGKKVKSLSTDNGL